MWLEEEGDLREYGGLSRDLEKDRILKIAKRKDHEASSGKNLCSYNSYGKTQPLRINSRGSCQVSHFFGLSRKEVTVDLRGTYQ